MKIIIIMSLCLLSSVSSSLAVPDAARVAGDLRVDSIVFNNDNSSKQTKANPWSFSGLNIIYNEGNVGIGLSPIYKLDVSGTVRSTNTANSVAFYGINNSTVYPTVELINEGVGSLIRGWTGTGPSLKFSVGNNGDGYFAGIVTASNIGSPSDLRLKTNILPLENTLEKVQHLRGVSYVLKADETQSRKIGVIAQELEQEYPEMVLTDENGMKSVAYANLTPVLIEAVKTLKAENDLLKGRLGRIEKLLNIIQP